MFDKNLKKPYSTNSAKSDLNMTLVFIHMFVTQTKLFSNFCILGSFQIVIVIFIVK